ncbi:MAG: alanine--tRNA ligase [Acidimicrobiales bacterium]
MNADQLRNTFTKFFVDRGHLALPAASLVPNDPSMLFTIAGMVQFKPYFLAEAPPPGPRATTVQPCVRTVDIDVTGTSARHVTFFEMLGNFSFGDYFKDLAIAYAWELLTGELGLDPEHLWVTVHVSDDEAEALWRDIPGLLPGRLQRLDEDNFWKMGETGPCGPCSEIFFDRGSQYGPGGGPAQGGERYVELWNLVFIQYNRHADGSLTELPQRNIDTGAGLDRILTQIQGVESVFDTDLIAPVLDAASAVTGRVYGSTEETDVGLRIVADHARTFTFLISEGVFPSNESRGYVLRRLIRRAVLVAQRLGAKGLVTPDVIDVVTDVMGGAYPKLQRDRDLVKRIAVHEEEAFLRTLRSGTTLLEAELATGGSAVGGDIAFQLHDTYGFPIDLTEEIARERGIEVDRRGFDMAMEAQRRRAREAGRAGTAAAEDVAAAWSEIRMKFGPTQFLGYQEVDAESRVLAVMPSSVEHLFANVDGEQAPDAAELIEVFLDRTPFYAEAGGQVGDTGSITTSTGRVRVLDATSVVEGLTRHLGYLLEGSIEAGQEAAAAIDRERRESIRRNHTGTHLLHWALRQVLGDHVRQQGSLVAPDRLRFDFSHFGPMSEEEIWRVEDLVNSEILRNEPVRVHETTRQEAEGAGAMAFFGEKYGDIVRVVEAGDYSVELCGGTHVNALGTIGPLQVVSEASIGSNTRRIEAVTGEASLARLRLFERTVEQAAQRLRTQALDLPSAVDRLLASQRALEEQLRTLRSEQLRNEADVLAAEADGPGATDGSAIGQVAGRVFGRVVGRRDGLEAGELRDLAIAVRDHPGVEAVGLVGVTGPERVALVVAARKGSGIDARAAAVLAATAVGGGGGGTPELATAGGRNVAGIEEALIKLGEALGRGPGGHEPDGQVSA